MLSFKQTYKKYSAPILIFSIFTIIGIIVGSLRGIQYFALFSGIGFTEFVARVIVIARPQYLQAVRRGIQILLALLLFGGLSLYFGVNFQFEQIFFDFQAGIVTGALIQFVIARLIIPFLCGNAFCSRVCWDGAVFEALNPQKPITIKRKEWLAWLYIALLIGITVLVSWQFTNPADPNFDNANILLRRNWIIGQNIFIISVGLIMSYVGGSRFYCRMLCPFMTISSLFYKLSFQKITPVKSEECIKCGKCNKACPMGSDIMKNVAEKHKVDNKLCILCERCVSSCPKKVLTISHKAPK